MKITTTKITVRAAPWLVELLVLACLIGAAVGVFYSLAVPR